MSVQVHTPRRQYLAHGTAASKIVGQKFIDDASTTRIEGLNFSAKGRIYAKGENYEKQPSFDEIEKESLVVLYILLDPIWLIWLALDSTAVKTPETAQTVTPKPAVK